MNDVRLCSDRDPGSDDHVVFYVSVGVWLTIVVASFVVSKSSRARSVVTERFAAPLSWVALGAALVAGVAPLIAPGFDGEPEPGEFSAERAQAHIDVIAAEPHPMGSPAIEEVRNYLVEQLQDLGLDPELQPVPGVRDYYTNSDTTVPVVNVIGRIPGTAPTGSIALVAHFDTVPATPGANDNTSGVAVVLETARLLVAQDPPRNDVILLFTDGEEPAPKFGSTAFVAHHRWADDIRFVVNLESIGTSGPSMLSETNGPQSWVLDRYAVSTPQPVAFSFLTQTTELIGGSNTDFAPFRNAGTPGVEFVYARGSPIYHSAADSSDSVSARSLHSHGVNTVALVRQLAHEDLSAIEGGDMVFFTVGRHHVVRYPSSWALPLALLAGLALFGAIGRRHERWLTTAKHAGWTAAISISLAVGAAVVWVGLAGWRNTMGIAESYLYLSGFTALVVGTVAHLRRPGAERPITPEGVLVVWWIVGLLTTFFAPGMSYLFVVPVLLGSLALAAGSSLDHSWERLGTAVLTVGVVFVVLIPAIDTFFQFAQPRPGNPDSEILPTVSVPVLLIALVAFLATSLNGQPGWRVTTTPAAPTPAEPQPLEAVNALRVGTLVGTLLGAAIVAFSGVLSFWIIAGLAAAGGVIGYWSANRRQRSR